MCSKIIGCEKLGKHFGDTQVLTGVNLTLYEATVTGIVGPSGCGKTTLLRMLAGLETLTEGSIVFHQGSPRTSFVFQESRLIPWLSVIENTSFVLEGEALSSEERTKRAVEALESVELGDYLDYYPDQLSGGMKQRVSLARALVFRPGILFMDEPFTGLDFPLRMQLIRLLNCLLNEHPMSVAFVSHDSREITHLCDYVCVLGGEPCTVREMLTLKSKQERFTHPGYIQKIEEHTLNIMCQ